MEAVEEELRVTRSMLAASEEARQKAESKINVLQASIGGLSPVKLRDVRNLDLNSA